MEKTVDEMISEFTQQESKEQAELQTSLGDVSNAWLAYIAISGEWKSAADKAFSIGVSMALGGDCDGLPLG